MKTIDKLQSKVGVTIHWIKAHVGHEGNEKADTLAKEGTRKITFQVEPIIPVPKTWIKNKINEYLHKEWTNRWLGISEARQTKIFMPKPNSRISNKLMSYNKETCAKLFRWITGHSFHRYHNHLTKPTIYMNPACRICNYEKEETSHLFAQCPGLAPIRMKICGMTSFSTNHNWSPHLLLSMINEIDKICPEELTQTDQAETSRNVTNNGNSMITE
jgi:ribonuclease HI